MNGLSSHELDRLILALLDDVITVEEHRVLQDNLLASDAARDRYLQLSALQNLLELVAETPLVVKMPKPLSIRGRENQPMPRRPARTKPERLSVRSGFTREGRRRMRRSATVVIGTAIRSKALLATTVIVVGIAAILGLTLVSPPPAARVAASPGSVFTITHSDKLKRPPKENTLSPGSSLDLVQGTVELTLASNVRGVFQGPETITLIDDRHLALKRGAAWFHVPPNAVGFEVLTPQLQIVDLGTEFGVVSRPDGADEIHVLTGKVEAKVRKGAAATESLVAGESRSVTQDGGLARIDTKPELFLTNLPAALPCLHWSFDESGLDRLATDGGHPAAGHVATKVVSPGITPAFASVPGKFGAALSSPGGNGYLESDWPGIEGSAPRTIAYWINLPPGQQCLNPVVGWGSRTSHRSFFTYLKTSSNGTVAAMSCDSFWLEGSIPIGDGQWHHLAVVYTGRSQPDGDPEIYCYVDGQKDRMTRDALTSVPADSGGNIAVNTLCSGPDAIPLSLFTNMFRDRKMPGFKISLAIDELYVFPAALSQRQINDLYLHNQLEPDHSSASPAR